MEFIPRYYEQTYPRNDDDSSLREKTIEYFFDSHAFVVLGEPGLGKTTSFEYAQKKEKNSLFIRIGEFISGNSIDEYRDKTLYLDGLDEHRTRVDNKDVIDILISKLRELGCPKFRISCRTAEWSKNTDLKSLEQLTGNDNVIQIVLKPLRKQDIKKLIGNKLIGNVDDFIDVATENGFEEFLFNPQDCLLLCNFYNEKNRWPDNRTELMHGACNELLKEPNDLHYKSIDDWVKDRDLKTTSDYLAALMMLSNITGISGKRIDANKSYPCIHELEGDIKILKAALGRHLFRPCNDEKDLIEPKHKKISEFMAARYLAAIIRKGLSLNRVMSLMTTFDGKIAPELRGVYGWLITFLTGMTEHILGYDPFGAIIYGDPASWSPYTKITALQNLIELSKQEPWFREEKGNDYELKGFSDTCLCEAFKQIINTDECKSHLLSTIFDAISVGPELPNLCQDLIRFIKNNSKPNHLRSDAINAFVKACPDKSKELIKILKGIDSGSIKDNELYLRGEILKLLYPKVIKPEHILDYIIDPGRGIINRYHMFIHHYIFENTDFDGLKIIAAKLKNRRVFSSNDSYYEENNFRGNLLEKLLENAREDINAKEVLTWFQIISEDYRGHIDESSARKIRGYINDNPDVYLNCFLEYLNTLDFEKESLSSWFNFLRLMANAKVPEQFPRKLLNELNNIQDTLKAKIIFSAICFESMNYGPLFSTISIDELENIVEKRKELDEVFEEAKICKIDAWRQEEAVRKRKEVEEKQKRRQQNIDELTPMIKELENGEQIDVFLFFAKIWLCLFVDVDSEASPEQRIQNEVDDNLFKAIIDGFQKIIFKNHFNSIEEIAAADSENKHYVRGYILLVGLEVLYKKDKVKLLEVSDNILKIAFSYYLSFFSDNKLTWPSYLAYKKKSLFSELIYEYWCIQLSSNSAYLSRFHDISSDQKLKKSVAKKVLQLLAVFYDVKTSVLKDLISFIKESAFIKGLEKLVRDNLSKKFKNKDNYTVWLATAFVLFDDEYHKEFVENLKRNDEQKWIALPILLKNKEYSEDTSAIKYKRKVLEILGPLFNNVSYPVTGEARTIGDRDEPTAANNIRNLIYSLSRFSNDEATEALTALKDNRKLSVWKIEISYALTEHYRLIREARFNPPDIKEVVSTLANEEPANVSDLKALTLDALNSVSDEIRHGNTNTYRNFWSVKSTKYLKGDQIDENSARNILLDKLRPKFQHLDITIEPEALYADEKRADIAVYYRTMKLPIEIKKDSHRELWQSAETQLKERYARDPASEGYGIYLIFWFGGEKIVTPPNNLTKPTSADELKKCIESVMNEALIKVIDVVVIDVSMPPEIIKRSKKKTNKKKTSKKKTSKKKTSKKKTSKKKTGIKRETSKRKSNRI